MPKPDTTYRDVDKSWDRYLFLDTFDDENFECRTPKDWLAMGLDGRVRKPIPAFALLPTLDNQHNCEFFHFLFW